MNKNAYSTSDLYACRSTQMGINMTLYEAKKEQSYMVSGIYTTHSLEDNITRRLQALGLNDGTPITVITRKKHGALIIKVRGTRLALGKQIASKIEVIPKEGVSTNEN